MRRPKTKIHRYTKTEALAWVAGERNRSAGQHDAAVCAIGAGATWAEVAATIGISERATRTRYAGDFRLRPFLPRTAG